MGVKVKDREWIGRAEIVAVALDKALGKTERKYVTALQVSREQEVLTLNEVVKTLGWMVNEEQAICLSSYPRNGYTTAARRAKYDAEQKVKRAEYDRQQQERNDLSDKVSKIVGQNIPSWYLQPGSPSLALARKLVDLAAK